MNSFLSNHLLEMIATVTGLLNLWLVVRGRQLNWLFGMITVSLYFFIFLKVRLYAEMALQVVFLLLQFYGLYQWHSGRTAAGQLKIRTLSLSQTSTLLPAGLVLDILMAEFLQYWTAGTFIWIDALITTLSLIAQWLMAKRFLEHWLVWLLVDALSVGLYLKKSLYFSSLLYAVFFLFCLVGHRAWKKLIKIK